MVEVHPHLESLLRFLHAQGLISTADEDLSYGIHAWLSAAFGHMAPKPWRLFMDKRRPPRILGYSRYDAQELQQQIMEFADPLAYAVCPDPKHDIASKPMPSWRAGRRLLFEVQCCPVARKFGSGVEKDLYLIEVERSPASRLNRETVYCNWVQSALEANNAATVSKVHLDGFRLVHHIRKSTASGGERTTAHIVRPRALVRGELTIQNPDTFGHLVARGVGRHRAFGYGMLLLRPAG